LDELLIPVLKRWIDEQEKLICGSVTRSIRIDDLTSAYENAQFTSSVIDIIKILNVSTDFLCSLNIHNALEWALPLLAGVIGKAIVKYYEDAQHFPSFDFDDRDTLLIHKQAPWLENMPSQYEEGSSGSSSLQEELDIPSLVHARKVPLVEVTSAHELKILASKGRLMELCRLVHNAYYLFEQSKRLEDLIVDACDRYAIIKDRRRSIIEYPFEEIERVHQDYLDEISNYIGYHIIFVELRHAFGYQLYRPSIEENRIRTLLLDLQQIILLVRDVMNEDMVLIQKIVNVVFHYFVQFFEMVLLDGGPDRLFCDKDADLLLEDIHLIEKFFSPQAIHHEGYGVDPKGKKETERKVPSLFFYIYKNPMLIFFFSFRY
jgi:hypothetical protein